MNDKMSFHIKTLVYNDLYVDCFLNYSFPSMLSANNLPLITKIANVEHHIYTWTQDETDRISYALSKYSSLLPIKVQITPYPRPEDQNLFWEHFINNNPAPLLFSHGDSVWSDGSLSYIVNSLINGNVAICPSVIPVTLETISQDFNIIKKNDTLTLSPILAQRLVIRHLSPFSGCFNHKSPLCFDWPDCFFVPVGTEGILMYPIAQGFRAIIPRSFPITATHYVEGSYNTYKVDTIRDGNCCIGMNLQALQGHLKSPEMNNSIARLLQLLKTRGIPFNAQNMASFIKHPRWINALEFNIESLKRPFHISLVNNPTKELWDSIEKEIRETIIKEIIDYSWRDMAKFPPTSISDQQLQDTLKWLQPVINGRFPQSSLEYLKIWNTAEYMV